MTYRETLAEAYRRLGYSEKEIRESLWLTDAQMPQAAKCARETVIPPDGEEEVIVALVKFLKSSATPKNPAPLN